VNGVGGTGGPIGASGATGNAGSTGEIGGTFEAVTFKVSHSIPSATFGPNVVHVLLFDTVDAPNDGMVDSSDLSTTGAIRFYQPGHYIFNLNVTFGRIFATTSKPYTVFITNTETGHEYGAIDFWTSKNGHGGDVSTTTVIRVQVTTVAEIKCRVRNLTTHTGQTEQQTLTIRRIV
jgi:hypothetical protein